MAQQSDTQLVRDPDRDGGFGEEGSQSADRGVVMSGITKNFGAVTACRDVSLELRPGRIHGILGENGAGKSTLMKILCGMHLPDAGSLEIRGATGALRSPEDARRLGVAMVHQHFSLVPALRVWENVLLGDHGPLREKATRQRIAEVSQHYGLDIDPDAKVESLPVGIRQRVEIVKCLINQPQTVIMDEPTSVLSPAESEFLFEVLRRVVSEENRCVALVSHKLKEILAATDDITIMRQGEVVAQLETKDATAEQLANSMVGRKVNLPLALPDMVEGGVSKTTADAASDAAADADPASVSNVSPVLSIRDATAVDPSGAVLLDSLSLEVYPGEITAVAGVEGNGQSALDQLLSSLLPLQSGWVEVDGSRVAAGKPGAFEQAGVSIISEDRHHLGCVMDMTVAENLFLSNPGGATRGGFMRPSLMADQASRTIDDYNIVTSGPDALMWSLSGGNQQRVVLARALTSRPKVLIASQPTRGLDVGAVEYFLERLKQVAQDGLGVLFISHELEEILHVADRVVVIFDGRIMGEMTRQNLDMQRLGLLMGGVDPAP